MKRFCLFLLCSLPALLLSSCATSPNRANDHWSAYSVGPRMAWVLLGYDPDRDESYLDRLREDGKHIGRTFVRHFGNHNPDNPFQNRD